VIRVECRPAGLDVRKGIAMDEDSYVIPKKLVPVMLWIHPEGRVHGSMFVHLPGADSAREEQPSDVINESVDFVAIEREDPDELRFYNKSSIVRVHYQEQTAATGHEGRAHPCRITMMDGSLIEAEICKVTPEGRSRLYDYMNDTRERFLKVRAGGPEVILINKSYVVYISAVEARNTVVAGAVAEAAPGASLAMVA